MNCPRCNTAVLDERDRDGIVVDACPSCRGIWLDRGELEKLIARATRELDELEARRPERAPEPQRYEDRPDRGRPYADAAYGEPPYRDRPYRDHDDDHYRRYPRRKKSWVEMLGDVFD
ncbi:MAG TPA: zf-TFIIB domain-containing protein [Candidatus Limnocylindrales bacterium]|nr:zf-TFIIB domain-containing protein [Candidatus Limnocylindrales bacterium]